MIVAAEIVNSSNQLIHGIEPIPLCMSVLVVEDFIVGSMMSRTVLLTCTETGETAVFDAGDEPERIINWVDSGSGEGPDSRIGEVDISSDGENQPLKRIVTNLYATHAHFDHTGSMRFLQEHWAADFHIHQTELEMLAVQENAAASWGFSASPPPDVTSYLNDGDVINVGKHQLEVLHTPGHTYGGLCFLHRREGEPNILISGDTLFEGGVGRTDLPGGGDWNTLQKSIKERLFTLDDDTIVLPGHGGRTTIGKEKRSNPFVGEDSDPSQYGIFL